MTILSENVLLETVPASGAEGKSIRAGAWGDCSDLLRKSESKLGPERANQNGVGGGEAIPGLGSKRT
jgi:hypothetical protein